MANATTAWCNNRRSWAAGREELSRWRKAESRSDVYVCRWMDTPSNIIYTTGTERNLMTALCIGKRPSRSVTENSYRNANIILAAMNANNNNNNWFEHVLHVLANFTPVCAAPIPIHLDNFTRLRISPRDQKCWRPVPSRQILSGGSKLSENVAPTFRGVSKISPSGNGTAIIIMMFSDLSIPLKIQIASVKTWVVWRLSLILPITFRCHNVQ